MGLFSMHKGPKNTEIINVSWAHGRFREWISIRNGKVRLQQRDIGNM
jgi:hypothetical protein